MKLFFLLLLINTGMYLNAQKYIHLASPSGKIVFTFKLTGGNAFYNISYKNKILIENSSLSLLFDNGPFENNLSLKFPRYRDTTEEYTLVVGKTNLVSPVFHWSDAEMETYLKQHSLPNEWDYFDPAKADDKRECGLHAAWGGKAVSQG